MVEQEEQRSERLNAEFLVFVLEQIREDTDRAHQLHDVLRLVALLHSQCVDAFEFGAKLILRQVVRLEQHLDGLH